MQQPRIQRSLLIHGLIIGIVELIDAGENFICTFGRKLAPVLPIDLVAVVNLRIMAGGDDNARDAVQLADSKGQHRNGAQTLVKIGLDAVGAEHQRSLLRKLFRELAGIVGNRHAALRAALHLSDELGKALRRPADVIDVHAVGAVSDHAAHARRAEFQSFIEAILDLLVVALQTLQFRDQLRVVRKVLQPLFIHFSGFHG